MLSAMGRADWVASMTGAAKRMTARHADDHGEHGYAAQQPESARESSAAAIASAQNGGYGSASSRSEFPSAGDD